MQISSAKRHSSSQDAYDIIRLTHRKAAVRTVIDVARFNVAVGGLMIVVSVVCTISIT